MKKVSEKQRRWIERTVANDRSYKILLYNRFFLTLIFVLAQLLAYALLFLSFAQDPKVGVFVQTAVFLLAIVFVLRIINATTHPSTKLNWIIVILLFPIFGVPMYLFNGGGRPMWRMKRKVGRSKAEVYQRWKELEQDSAEGDEVRKDRIAYSTEKFGGYPMYNSGSVQYFSSGEEAFPQMLEALRGAKEFIFLEYYIIAHGKMWSEMLKILLEKAEQGVQVRILYDEFGCILTLPKRYYRYLEGLHENIQCMRFNKVIPIFSLRMNNRDHRKLLIVDGKTAFTGGVNLADEYIAQKRRFGYWKDSVIRLDGASVHACTAMFVYLWNAFRKEKIELDAYLPPANEEKTDGLCIQPYDDSPYDSLSLGESVYLNILDKAERYVWICTPYLILDDLTCASICRAATRGVDVRIVTPGIPDKKISYRLTRANYDVLIRAGVKIYEYTPGFIHAKNTVSDDRLAVVGTINFDYRSLYHNMENAVYISGCTAVQDVKQDFEAVFATSRLVEEKDLKRTWLGRLFDAVLRVFETAF